MEAVGLTSGQWSKSLAFSGVSESLPGAEQMISIGTPVAGFGMPKHWPVGSANLAQSAPLSQPWSMLVFDVLTL